MTVDLAGQSLPGPLGETLHIGGEVVSQLLRGGGDHGVGRAVDIMVSGSLGWQVAEFVRAHYAELGVSYVIYSQRIWSLERGGEGWRAMSDRGSTTANHYDHVHVSVF